MPEAPWLTNRFFLSGTGANFVQDTTVNASLLFFL